MRVLISEKGMWEGQCPRDATWETLCWPLLALETEEGDRSQEKQAVSSKWKKQGNRFYSRASQRHNCVDPLVQWDLLRTAHLQNCNIISLCCFKPPHMWWFTIALGNTPFPLLVIGKLNLIPTPWMGPSWWWGRPLRTGAAPFSQLPSPVTALMP